MSKRISSERTLLPTTEASKLTGFSTAYIQRLLRQERIEGEKVGPVWLAYEDSLKAFLAQPRKRGPKGPRKSSKTAQHHLDTSSEHEHNGRGMKSGRENQETE